MFRTAAIFTGLVVYVASFTAAVNVYSLPTQCSVFQKPGQFVVGGMFTIARWSTLSCNFTDDEISLGMLLPEAMAFAIGEVNTRDDILPNITLGFEIWDSGWQEDIAVGLALSFVNDLASDAVKTGDPQVKRDNIIGIVGPDSSTSSIIVSKITQPFQVPVISNWATSNELSNKARFPYFLRSVPPDQLQAGAIVDLLLRFNWVYVAVIYTTNSYGLHGARLLTTQAEKSGVCIAMTAPLSNIDTERDLLEIVLRLRSLNYVRVVVMFANGALPYKLMQEFKKVDFPYEITWIVGDGWGYSLKEYDQEELVRGGIFVRLNQPVVPAFEKYLKSVDPRLVNAAGPWFTRYWGSKLARINCTESDSLQSCAEPLSDGFSADYNILGVINAVNVFAQGLHSLLGEQCRFMNCSSVTASDIDGRNFLNHLRTVKFATLSGQFELNQDGDPQGIYILQNLQYAGGQYRFVDVGQWNSGKTSNKLQLQEQEIQWPGHQSSQQAIPRSTCRETCSIGYIVVPLELKCCWGCQKCGSNEIVVNGTECRRCPPTDWPNNDYDLCLPIVPETVSLAHPLISVILALNCLGILLVCLTVVGMVYYRHNRLVKATSRELSSINILGLVTGFLAVIPLIQPPSDLTCSTAEALIAMCFTMTYSPMLLKVNRIYRIFKAGRRSTRPPRFVGPGHQVILAGSLVVIQLLAVIVVGALFPAQSALLFTSPPSDHVELYCVFSDAFPVYCAYNLLIVVLCCYFAFRARKVPDNYNESKFIAVSVYSSLVMCLAAVPVYTTASETTQKVAVLSLAVIANSFLTIFFVYFPKLFAVRYRVTASSTNLTGTAITTVSPHAT